MFSFLSFLKILLKNEKNKEKKQTAKEKAW